LGAASDVDLAKLTTGIEERPNYRELRAIRSLVTGILANVASSRVITASLLWSPTLLAQVQASRRPTPPAS